MPLTASTDPDIVSSMLLAKASQQSDSTRRLLYLALAFRTRQQTLDFEVGDTQASFLALPFIEALSQCATPAAAARDDARMDMDSTLHISSPAWSEFNSLLEDGQYIRAFVYAMTHGYLAEAKKIAVLLDDSEMLARVAEWSRKTCGPLDFFLSLSARDIATWPRALLAVLLCDLNSSRRAEQLISKLVHKLVYNGYILEAQICLIATGHIFEPGNLIYSRSILSILNRVRHSQLFLTMTKSGLDSRGSGKNDFDLQVLADHSYDIALYGFYSQVCQNIAKVQSSLLQLCFVDPDQHTKRAAKLAGYHQGKGHLDPKTRVLLISEVLSDDCMAKQVPSEEMTLIAEILEYTSLCHYIRKASLLHKQGSVALMLIGTAANGEGGRGNIFSAAVQHFASGYQTDDNIEFRDPVRLRSYSCNDVLLAMPFYPYLLPFKLSRLSRQPGLPKTAVCLEIIYRQLCALVQSFPECEGRFRFFETKVSQRLVLSDEQTIFKTYGSPSKQLFVSAGDCGGSVHTEALADASCTVPLSAAVYPLTPNSMQYWMGVGKIVTSWKAKAGVDASTRQLEAVFLPYCVSGDEDTSRDLLKACSLGYYSVIDHVMLLRDSVQAYSGKEEILLASLDQERDNAMQSPVTDVVSQLLQKGPHVLSAIGKKATSKLGRLFRGRQSISDETQLFHGETAGPLAGEQTQIQIPMTQSVSLQNFQPINTSVLSASQTISPQVAQDNSTGHYSSPLAMPTQAPPPATKPAEQQAPVVIPLVSPPVATQVPNTGPAAIASVTPMRPDKPQETGTDVAVAIPLLDSDVVVMTSGPRRRPRVRGGLNPAVPHPQNIKP